MPPIDEPASFEPKAAAGEGRKKAPASTPEQAADAGLIALTVDAGSGRIVAIERVDGAGARHPLSEEERARLIGAQPKATLEGVVEQAFEAGIECVLGDAGEKEPAESKEDAELSRILLRSLIERSGAGRLLQRNALHRAIIGTLIEHAATPASASAH